ncbi:MAG: hypothetical protein KA099_07455 [Alphaproteobacteria bacterium]|nr:hypothetical protein [Alphaproteobacteria bacterium]MBP7757630.1 hypothetical protein [Alphaproteobacteria bacterium]MBP7761170.1 hypothetical protein [Alphaproteobacteria bacterium]MBP7905147.1 hypothetical protein [Alphaproteobacteria bacterium]
MPADIKHYNQSPKRNAEFIKPPNMIKAKVGSGGLNDAILDRAQKLLENTTVDFAPLAEIYLTSMMKGIVRAKKPEPDDDNEFLIAGILYPCAQLKANGGMFHYPLVTRIADRFVQFLEVVDKIDYDALEIAEAFHTTIKTVITAKIKGDGGKDGNELVEALNDACMRYFEKNKHNLRQPDEGEEF